MYDSCGINSVYNNGHLIGGSDIPAGPGEILPHEINSEDIFQHLRRFRERVTSTHAGSPR
jgi:hypothetical protein